MAGTLALIGSAKVGTARLGWPTEFTDPPKTIRINGECWGLVQDPGIVEAAQAAAEAKADAIAKADAAEAAAIAASTIIAQSKADTAEANAKAASATDAQTKADKAEADAVAAAKTATDLAASGAKSEAIAAAQSDATAKADAAREAAKAAAALDATAKANQAKADATTAAANDATAKANTAQAAAIAAAAQDATSKSDGAKAAAIKAAAADATAKANQAKADAATAAATDAQTKADAAQAAALAAAKTYADAQSSGAGGAALDAAKADATAKADAAKAAAVTAAALDATAKANQAKADAAVDAKAKADAALEAAKADATAKAGQAKTDAIAEATTMTNGIGKNLSSTAAPTTANKAPKGSFWRRTDSSGRIIGSWEQTGAGIAGTWTPRLISSEAIDNLDVGKLSASSGVINDLVAQAFAAKTASIQTADIANLFVTTATMSEAVINRLFADVVKARMVMADEFIGENAILTGSITAPKIIASEELSAKLGEFLKVSTGMLEANAVTADKADIGSLRAGILTANVVDSTMVKGDAIDGKTITGATVQTDVRASRGIKLLSSGLFAYNAAGGTTLRIDASDGSVTATKGTFTGMTFQTSETARRGVKIHSGGLFAYDNTGATVLSANSSTGNVFVVGRFFSDLPGSPGVTILPVSEEGTGRNAIWFTESAGTVGGSETPGVWVEDMAANTSGSARNLNLRGHNGGGVNTINTLTAKGDIYAGRIWNPNSNFDIRSDGSSWFGAMRFTGTVRLTATDNTTQSANAHIDPNGKVWKSSSASRFKLDQKPTTLPDSLLEVPVKDWVDKGQTDAHTAIMDGPRPHTQEEARNLEALYMGRVPGVIAEEVEAAGGQLFVSYNKEGQIEQVSESKLALAQISILKRQLDAALARIDALEAK